MPRIMMQSGHDPERRLARGVALAGLVVASGLGVLWVSGALSSLQVWAGAQQLGVQNALAGAVKALRRGDAGAWGALIAVCFSYGFLHAVGPGHGKAVIGAYGVARRVALLPILSLALLSSLAQSAFAVLLVYAGVVAFGWTRPQLEGVADTTFVPLSYAMVAGLGLWLVWRGLRHLSLGGHGASHGHSHAHPSGIRHSHDAACGCGHAHGPSAEQVAQVTSLRDAVVVIAAVALRPCSGALFLLVLTFAMGIGLAGVIGTFAMGLGTATVTVLVAGLAFWAREGALGVLSGGGLARALPLAEVVAGAGIAAVALLFLAQSL